MSVAWKSESGHPAGVTNNTIVGCIDMYPTILDLVGVHLSLTQKVDGVSFAPVLKQTGKLARDTYFCWFPHLIPGVSVRQGDWKLIRRFTERPSDYAGLHELFNLKEDLGETNNLAATMPEKVKELDALIDQFVKDTGALYPQPNPAYKPRSTAKTATDPMQGLVPKGCKATFVSGALRVEASGKTPFLGTAQVKGMGPLTMQLRVRSVAGGPGKVQWKTKDQEEFTKTGQTVDFTLTAVPAWQDINVALPIKGQTSTLRVFLPADKAPVEIESLRFFAAGSDKPLHAWIFGAVK